MDNKDNDMTLSCKDNSSNNKTKLNVVCSLQMETQTLDDNTLAIRINDDDSPFDDCIVDAPINESAKDDATDLLLSINSEEAPTPGNESVKKSKKRLYMGRSSSASDEYVSGIAKLEREIRRLRLENEKLKLINMKEMECLNKRNKAITKPSGNNKLLDDDDESTRQEGLLENLD